MLLSGCASYQKDHVGVLENLTIEVTIHTESSEESKTTHTVKSADKTQTTLLQPKKEPYESTDNNHLVEKAEYCDGVKALLGVSPFVYTPGEVDNKEEHMRYVTESLAWIRRVETLIQEAAKNANCIRSTQR